MVRDGCLRIFCLSRLLFKLTIFIDPRKTFQSQLQHPEVLRKLLIPLFFNYDLDPIGIHSPFQVFPVEYLGFLQIRLEFNLPSLLLRLNLLLPLHLLLPNSEIFLFLGQDGCLRLIGLLYELEFQLVLSVLLPLLDYSFSRKSVLLSFLLEELDLA